MADGLLNKASIILTPTGYKAGTLYNVAPIDEPYEDFDFARTSTATRINSSGLVSNVATGVPRISYDSNGDNGHILLEPTSTNLNKYSNSLTAINDGQVFLNNAISPDGTLNATKVIFGSSTNDGALINVGGSPCVASTVYTFSFYAKSIVGDGRFNLRIDTNSQALLVSENFTATSEWVRYTHTFTSDSSATSFGSNSRYRKVTSNNEILFYGMQLEKLGYATSLIPTLTGSTETRATETATGAGSADLINSTEGVLYAEIAMLSEDDKASSNQIAISDGTTNNRVLIFCNDNGDILVQLKDTTETPLQVVLTALDQSQGGVDTAAFNKIALLYKSGQNKLFVNGSQITNSAFNNFVFDYSSLDNLEFGSGANSNYFRGKVKALAVFNVALSDSELTQLTT